MIAVLPTVLTVIALLIAAGALAMVIADRPLALGSTPTTAIGVPLVLLEIGLVVQAVVGLVRMSGADREIDELTFVGYLFGPVVVVPVAVVWALAERTRFGPGVLLVGCLSVPAMILRLTQIWAGHA
ncbi:hypothetical protein [Umezawaea sp.]|uniref:hypothetical protein n=1 Tax=Umezawaea sp. TaxID=1955258 RepID=UPI002ECFC253